MFPSHDLGWLGKYDRSDGSLVESVDLTDGDVYHIGGIDMDYDGNIYVVMAEYTQYPTEPSVIYVYDQDLDLVRELCDSSVVGNDHWGGVACDDSENKLYVANWDSLNFDIIDLDSGDYLGRLDAPSGLLNIQDMNEVDGFIYGSIQDGDANLISVIRLADWMYMGGH